MMIDSQARDCAALAMVATRGHSGGSGLREQVTPSLWTRE
jgi:hypothetical protein